MLSNGQFGQWRPSMFDANRRASIDLELGSSCSSKQVMPSKQKRKRPKFIRKVTCQVCGDVANDHIHYGAIACYSCRAFFRRGVNANAPYYCSQSKSCVISKHTRKHCQFCRFQKCLTVGMKGSWVMTEEDKREKKEKALIKKIQKMKKEDVRFGSPPLTMSEDLSHHSSSSPPPPPHSTGGGAVASFSHPRQPSHPPVAHSSQQYHLHEYNNYHLQEIKEEFSPGPPSPAPSTSSSCSVPPPAASSSEYSYQRAHSTTSSSDREQENECYSSDSCSRMDTASPSRSSTSGRPDVSFFLDPAAIAESPTNQPVMVFTAEERQLVQNVISTEMDTTREIAVNPEVLMSFIRAAKTGCVIPYNVLLEGYTTCMKRIIKFASRLDFFQSFGHEDQRNLLLSNTDMIVNIRSARLLRPGNNLQIQLQHAVGGDSDCTALEPFKTPCRVEYQQVYQSPWACDEKHERQFATLMENLFHLEMDKTTTMLMSMIVLFSSNNADLKDQRRCTQNQEFFTHMLYRYLCCTVGKVNATRLLPKYMYLISQLEEMAQIMITKRLML